MTENQYPDPFGEAAARSAQSFFRNAATVAALGRAYLQARARAQQRDMIRREQEQRELEAREKAEREAVRAQWAPAADRRWLRSANLREVAEIWSAAVPYASPEGPLWERSAQLAVENCEARLRELHPYAMSHYDRLRSEGLSRIAAIGEAGPLFFNHPNARPQGSSPRLGIPAQGLGHPWVDEPLGPSREGFEQHVVRQQTARGSRIVDRMQSRALAAGRPLLDPDEQRTALTNATNLPDEIIGQVVQPGPVPARRPASRPWENESPFSIEEVVAFAAEHPDRLAGPAPGSAASRARDRVRHV